ETVAEDAVVGDRVDPHLQRSVEGRRIPRNLLPLQRRRQRTRTEVRRRQTHPARSPRSSPCPPPTRCALPNAPPDRRPARPAGVFIMDAAEELLPNYLRFVR